jgi:hypothetical protein
MIAGKQLANPPQLLLLSLIFYVSWTSTCNADGAGGLLVTALGGVLKGIKIPCFEERFTIDESSTSQNTHNNNTLLTSTTIFFLPSAYDVLISSLLLLTQIHVVKNRAVADPGTRTAIAARHIRRLLEVFASALATGKKSLFTSSTTPQPGPLPPSSASTG